MRIAALILNHCYATSLAIRLRNKLRLIISFCRMMTKSLLGKEMANRVNHTCGKTKN